MTGSLGWKCVVVISFVLAFLLCDQAFSQSNKLYNDAVRMHARYKQNQDQINALRQSIAGHQAAIRSINRDMRSVAYGYGSVAVLDEFAPQIAAHNEAIARDRQSLALLERRQAIIERSWENNPSLKTYYGSLRETSNRTIYDPRTKQNVNLMDFRMDSFRNPGGKPVPPGVRTPPSGQGRSPGPTGPTSASRPTHGTSKTKGSPQSPQSPHSPSTKKSSSTKKSGSTAGGSHSISLVPVD